MGRVSTAPAGGGGRPISAARAALSRATVGRGTGAGFGEIRVDNGGAAAAGHSRPAACCPIAGFGRATSVSSRRPIGPGSAPPTAPTFLRLLLTSRRVPAAIAPTVSGGGVQSGAQTATPVP